LGDALEREGAMRYGRANCAHRVNVRAGAGGDFMVYTHRRNALSREAAEKTASREFVPTCDFRGAAAVESLIRHNAAPPGISKAPIRHETNPFGHAAAGSRRRNAWILGEFDHRRLPGRETRSAI